MCNRIPIFALIALALLVQPLLPTHIFATPSSDFDGDGTVGFSDFLQLVGVFGSSRGDDKYDAKYDLDSNGAIDFSDFLIFVDNFGKEVPPSDGGGTSTTSTPTSPFDLDDDNRWPAGITYANNRFYVLDNGGLVDGGLVDDKVYAYTSSGQREASADFDLDDDNSRPAGITYANNHFYVVDSLDDKVYVYTGSEP